MFQQIEKDGTIPLIDIGTISHIRQGHITIFTEIDCIKNNTVYFTDGNCKAFDAIIAAIGYERSDAAIIDVETTRFEDAGISIYKQKYFGKDDLYFCGFHIPATGLIREITLEAMKIAKDIAKKESVFIKK